MAQDPMSPELARLVEQGRAQQAQQRSREASLAARLRTEGYRHMRVAIGGYRGSLLRRAFVALIVLGPVLGGASLAWDLFPVEVSATLIAIAWPSFFAFIFLPPIASKRAVAAEEAWAASRPFELTGYFEALSATPEPAVRLSFEVTWRPGVRPPDPALVLNACRAVDPVAQVDAVTPTGLRITSGEISGRTGIRNNHVPVYRNHRMARSAHAFLDTVLTTLHASYPIARVNVTRWSMSISAQQLFGLIHAARG
jgi:hypothetical protein